MHKRKADTDRDRRQTKQRRTNDNFVVGTYEDENDSSYSKNESESGDSSEEELNQSEKSSSDEKDGPIQDDLTLPGERRENKSKNEKADESEEEQSTPVTLFGSTIIGVHADRRFSTTLDILIGHVVIPAEDIHLRLSEGLHTGKGKATENHVAATFGLVLLCKSGEYNFIYYQLPVEFKSGETSSDGYQAIGAENLAALETWLAKTGALTGEGNFDSSKHAHSEQALVFYLKANYQDCLDQLIPRIGDGDQVVALVLDVASVPNTVCRPCHCSLEALMTDGMKWIGDVCNYLAKNNVSIADKLRRVIRASAPQPFPGALGQLGEGKNKKHSLTNIGKLDADIVIVEQLKDYDAVRENDKLGLTSIGRAFVELESADVQEQGIYQIQLSRGAKNVRAGIEFSSGNRQWRVIFVEDDMVLLELISSAASSSSKKQATKQKVGERKYPSFTFSDWQHGPHRLPDEVIGRGVMDGQIILINDVQYRVRELRNMPANSTNENPQGKYMIAVPHLRGG